MIDIEAVVALYQLNFYLMLLVLILFVNRLNRIVAVVVVSCFDYYCLITDFAIDIDVDVLVLSVDRVFVFLVNHLVDVVVMRHRTMVETRLDFA
jgi:hypothetical protein